MFTIVRQQEFPSRIAAASTWPGKHLGHFTFSFLLDDMDFSFSLCQIVGGQDIFVIDKSLRPSKKAERLLLVVDNRKG